MPDTNTPAGLHTEPPELGTDERAHELELARRLAERYRVEFVDMDTFRIDQELFRSIPADLMLRYSFVPHRRDGKTLSIVVPDPTNLPMIDELSVLLGTPIKIAVGPKSAIESILPVFDFPHVRLRLGIRGDAGQLIFDLQECVIAEIEFIAGTIGRYEMRYHGEVGRSFCRCHP